MNIDYTAVGRRISYRRKQLGLTQRAVCEKAGMSDKYLSNAELAKTHPSLQVLVNLAEVLDTTLDFLVLGAPDHKLEPKIDSLYHQITELPEEQIDVLSAVMTVLKNK